jgi:hypothetical protein
LEQFNNQIPDMNQWESFQLLCQYVIPSANKKSQSGHQQILDYRDWDYILALADGYLVTPSFYLGLQQTEVLENLNKDVQNHLEGIYHLNCERNTELKSQALDAIQLFNSEGIQPILLKGIAGLLTGLYQHQGERVIGDIDLLVDQIELGKAVELFTANGYQCDQDTQSAVSSHSYYFHELSLFPKTGCTRIDLHVRPGRSGASAFVSSEYAKNQATQLVLEGATTLLPSPEFRLMHNFYHAQCHDYCYLNGSINLRQLIDWRRLWQMAESSVNNEAIEDRLNLHGQRHSFGLYVMTANKLLRQPMPADVRVNLFIKLLFLRQQLCLQYPWFYKLNAFITFVLRGILAFTPERLELGFGNVPTAKLLIIFIQKFFDPTWHKRKFDNIKRLSIVLLADRR